MGAEKSRKSEKKAFPQSPLYQAHFESATLFVIDEEDFERDTSADEILAWAPDHLCKYCAGGLVELASRRKSGEEADEYWLGVSQAVLGCLECGWWRYSFVRGGETTQETTVSQGAVLRPDDARLWAPAPLLREYLAKNPKYLKGIVDPMALEQVLRDVFAEYMEVEVTWTGCGADGGFDLFHVQSDQSTLYQIKRRRSGSLGESVVPVRAMLGTMFVNDAPRGIYVTTADHFSKAATETAEAAAERGLTLELVAYEQLLDILAQTQPKNLRPYDAMWKSDSPDYERLAAKIVEA